MNKVRKSLIAILISAVIISGAAAFSLLSEYRAAAMEEVDSLEKLRSTPVDEIAAWEKYDSRDYDIVTSVKNQGSTNLCWVYGSLAAMETNILRQGFSNKTKDDLNLDEEAFARASKGQWDDPLDIADSDDNRKVIVRGIWNAEGAIAMVTQFAARGQGVYEEGEMAEDAIEERYSSYWLRNAITCDNDVNAIKQLIAAYGGVAFTYHSGLIDKTYLYARGANDHASFIIGWDDNLDKRLFGDTYGNAPLNNGGWIVKNSYGTGSFEDGYCYLSYDSDLFEITAFDMMSADEYDYCYNYSDRIYNTKSYSVCSPTDPDTAEYAAIYKAQKGGEINEYLNAVSIGVSGKNAQVSVYVYADVDEAATKYSNNSTTFDPTGGTLAATVQCTAPSTGIYTIPLHSSVELAKDSYFTILVKISGGSLIYDYFAYRSGTMTYVFDNGKWNNLSSPMSNIAMMGLLCIKALTVVRAEEARIDISNGTLELSDISFTYTGSEHRPAVNLTLDGEIVSADNYTVEYANNINAGTATVTVTGTGKYADSLQTTFDISKADRSDFNVKLDDWTYGQTANSPSVSNYGLEAGNVKYTYGTSESGPFLWVIPQNAGTYYVRAEMDETANYEKAVAVSSFSILKAEAPEFPEELENLIITKEMRTLSEITLPSDWVWQDPDIQLITGEMEVYVVYVGEDSENFENTMFKLMLNVPEPAHQHKLILIKEKAATCTADGHISYYSCSDCNSWFIDENGENEIIDHDSVIISAAHDYAGVEWSSDEIGHWIECAVCHEQTERTDHNSNGENGECSICGYKSVSTDPDESGDGETPGENERPGEGDSETDTNQPTGPDIMDDTPNNGETLISGCGSSIGMGTGFGFLAIIIVAGIILITLRRSKKFQ